MNKIYLVIDHNWNQLQRYKALAGFLTEFQSLIPQENFEILYYQPTKTNIYKIFLDKYGVLLNLFYHNSGAPKVELPIFIQIQDTFAGKKTAYEVQIKADVFDGIRAELKKQFPTPVIVPDPPPSTKKETNWIPIAAVAALALLFFFNKK